MTNKMSFKIVVHFLFFACIMLITTNAEAKKSSSKSYTCISASSEKFIITDGKKTNAFKLYNVVFPTKKTIKQFAKSSNVKIKELTDYLPTIDAELNKYAGTTVKIKKGFRKGLWLEDSNGNSINLEVVENGFALPSKNAKREYKSQLLKAKGEAIKNARGVWALSPASNPTRDLRIEYSAKNMKKGKKSNSYKYSASSYSKNQDWKNIREITLDFNTFDLSHRIDLVIKYQFKIISYDWHYRKSHKRDISWSGISTKEITLFPPDNQKIVLKSPEVSINRYFNSDNGKSYLQGKDYAGDAVAIYYNNEVIFKRGELKN